MLVLLNNQKKEVKKMGEVSKKDGGKEAFDAEKIRRSIMKAMVDAGESVEERKDLVDKITANAVEKFGQKGDAATAEIKEYTLSALEKAGSKASNAWSKFDKKYKE